ncbi:hypothetical protein [Tsukamurella paurometabola]|uniref:DUF485 domain-containing protein n=1 Tax=Tsukamurella paurometabola TaxID=2061 RepID=A0A3P8K8R8_TSUPA|nr:hypothetical protein [Tsukamurella paurometabola]UEA83930.1 hypothetical protein LK411_03575 [Tsukamurella paurometabola]VDR41084.1 Uncharacterised protein [Tsukamurella paurometabola]
MKNIIRALDRRVLTTLFTVGYATALVLALFPPLYLWSSGKAVLILGIPLSLVYWIATAALVGLGLWIQYWVEDVRGELDESLVPDSSSAQEN